jgi:hypothetical protein
MGDPVQECTCFNARVSRDRADKRRPADLRPAGGSHRPSVAHPDVHQPGAWSFVRQADLASFFGNRLTFLRNHAQDIWPVDFLQAYGLFFRTLFVFVIVELESRRLVHFGVTRSPHDAWVAQQLREATPFGKGPRFLIRDNDTKFGAAFARVAEGTGIEVLTTPLPSRTVGGASNQGRDHLPAGSRWLASRLSAARISQALAPSRCLSIWRGGSFLPQAMSYTTAYNEGALAKGSW